MAQRQSERASKGTRPPPRAKDVGLSPRDQEARIASCDGKDRFTSYRIAKRIADRQAKRHNGPCEPYRCRFCNTFHVGTPAESVKNRARREARRPAPHIEDYA